MSNEVEREHRKRVRIRAEMRVDAERMDAVICNISSRGMMLTAEKAPQRGTYVEVSRAGVTTVARVIWTYNGRFGVRTRERLDVKAMMQPETRCMSLDAAPALPTAKVRTFGKAQVGVHHTHRAERNSWLGARMQFFAIGASVATFSGIAAWIAYELLSGVSLAVAAGLN